MTIQQEKTDHTVSMLHELGLGVHRLGYTHLTLAVPLYAKDMTQSLSKEIYPHIARCFGYPDWHCVERSVRTAILDAWDRRNPETWERYFPEETKAPTNKKFIATLAERLEQWTMEN